MNSIFLAISLISISLISTEIIPNDPTFFLNWITHETKWPMVIEKTLTNKADRDYDWFRYDIKDYVSQSPNFRENYFIGREEKKTELTIFSYNVATHEQLTTYEPMQISDLYNTKPSVEESPEFHTLTYLKSHRMRIDRNEPNTYVNVTCIADFLVDQSSLDINKNLVEDMKDLALFRVDLEEANRGDLDEFKQRVEHKKFVQGSQSFDEQIRYQRRINMKQMIQRARTNPEHGEQTKSKQHYNIIRTKRSVPSVEKNLLTKPIMNVRLSFGPIQVKQPISDRIISCSLNLVNTQKMIMDYDNTIYKFLTSRDLGMDKNAEDMLDTNTKVETDVKKMSDLQLNDMFEKQEVVDKMEQEIIKEKGPEMFKAIITDILELSKLGEAKEKEHKRRFLELNNMFMLDKPTESDLESLNTGNSTGGNLVNYAILIFVAVLNVFFY